MQTQNSRDNISMQSSNPAIKQSTLIFTSPGRAEHESRDYGGNVKVNINKK